jgi:thiol-disulfide isomerase/thioredoxin
VGVAVSQFRVRAPELTGRGGWLNTAEPLSLRQLRGKIVILDFWTFCCANCLHVLDELRPLEAKYRDVLVVVGVHSPKFAHETDHEAVANAVERYEVRHAVLDDPDLHVDGPAAKARLQHPLGVTLLSDKTVAISDTYNGAVRRYDPTSAEVTTLARDLAEPSGAVVVGDDLVVVESAAHRLVRPIAGATIVPGDSLSTNRPVSDVSADTELRVLFQPPPGRKLDDRYGPATRLSVSASPPDLLREGAGESSDLRRTLRLRNGQGVLHITAQAAACDDDPAIEHPACQVARQDWGVPIRVTRTGTNALRLVLLGE